ncbi:copper chaperone PCu(A)C [Alteromonadaceae bacterium BrNp21-10]|nr:copper chaperone PCu(A)C [Alteromonadaceae bacterium BrNp21-10]
MKALYGLVLGLMSLSVSAAISITDATIRVLPPMVPNTSAYFTLTNNDTIERTIVSAISSAAPQVEIHEHVMLDDMMRMQQVEKVVIAPGETVTFAPGGLHLMLFGLNKPLINDDKVSVTLQMKNGEQLEFTAIAQAPNAHHQHH